MKTCTIDGVSYWERTQLDTSDEIVSLLSLVTADENHRISLLWITLYQVILDYPAQIDVCLSMSWHASHIRRATSRAEVTARRILLRVDYL